jgi:hypothetical protein
MTSTASRTVPRGWRTATIVIAAIAAIVIAAVTGYMLSPKGASATASPLPEIGTPTIVDQQTLSKISAYVGPIYWNGPDADAQYEVTVTSGGSVYVRYLPKKVAAGSKDKYLTVATYRSADDLGDVLSGDKGATRVTGSNGAVIVTTAKAPLSAYFSFPEANFQVEVFSPKSGQAKELVDTGHVALVP